MLRPKIILLTAMLLLCLRAPGQGRLVSVLREQTLTLEQQIDSVVLEFGLDDIVPVACTDALFQRLKAPWHQVTYHRNKKGTHYETAVRSFIDFALILL